MTNLGSSQPQRVRAAAAIADLEEDVEKWYFSVTRTTYRTLEEFHQAGLHTQTHRRALYWNRVTIGLVEGCVPELRQVPE